MMNSRKLKEILLLVYITIPETFGVANHLSHLVHQIKNDFRSYEVTIMLDGKVKDREVSQIIRDLSSEVPRRVVNFLQKSPENLISSAESRSIHDTNLFLSILDEQTEPKVILSFLGNVYERHVHPRCLMIIFLKEKASSRKELLLHGWTMNFLDLTIVDLERKVDPRRKMAWDLERWKITIHHYNPFNNTYTRRNYSRSESIFPNKLLDMKGVKLNVNAKTQPHQCYAKFNSSGYLIKVTGPAANVALALSKMHNFTLDFFPVMNPDLRPCYRSVPGETEEIFYENRCHFQINPRMIPYYMFHRMHPLIIEDEFDSCKVVMPVIRSARLTVSITKATLYTGLLICFFVILIWFILKIFRFEKSFWQVTHFIQMLLTIPVSQDVSKLSDRIALVFILFGFWIVSSTLYSVLMDVRVTKGKEVEIGSFEDLLKLNMSVFTHKFIETRMKDIPGENTAIRELSNKLNYFQEASECARMLKKSKNILCIMNSEDTDYTVLHNFNNRGHKTVKEMDSAVLVTSKGLWFAKGSPFAHEFGKKRKWLTESGLHKKWKQDFDKMKMRSSRHKVEARESEIKSNLMGNQIPLFIYLLLILLTGYGISLALFAGELLMKYSEKRIHCKIPFSHI